MFPSNATTQTHTHTNTPAADLFSPTKFCYSNLKITALFKLAYRIMPFKKWRQVAHTHINIHRRCAPAGNSPACQRPTPNVLVFADERRKAPPVRLACLRPEPPSPNLTSLHTVQSVLLVLWKTNLFFLWNNQAGFFFQNTLKKNILIFPTVRQWVCVNVLHTEHRNHSSGQLDSDNTMKRARDERRKIVSTTSWFSPPTTTTHSVSDALISIHQLVGGTLQKLQVLPFALCLRHHHHHQPVSESGSKRRMLLVNKEASELKRKDDFALCVPGSPRIKFNVEGFAFHYEFMVGASMFGEVWEGFAVCKIKKRFDLNFFFVYFKLRSKICFFRLFLQKTMVFGITVLNLS